jgi:hypothetical protein
MKFMAPPAGSKRDAHPEHILPARRRNWSCPQTTAATAAAPWPRPHQRVVFTTTSGSSPPPSAPPHMETLPAPVPGYASIRRLSYLGPFPLFRRRARSFAAAWRFIGWEIYREGADGSSGQGTGGPDGPLHPDAAPVFPIWQPHQGRKKHISLRICGLWSKMVQKT